MCKKISDKEVTEILKAKGLKLLDGEIYKGIFNYIKCIDNEGFLIYSTLKRIKESETVSRYGNGNIFTIENIKHYIRNSQIELISDKYEKSNKPLIFKCSIHGEFTRSWNDIQQGGTCPKCKIIDNNKAMTKTHEEFCKEVYELVGNNYIVIGNYAGAKKRILIKHIECNTEYEVFPYAFLSGTRCPICYRKNNVGEKHPMYNPEKTDAERLQKRYELYNVSGRKWRNDVYKRDNFTCQCCGGRSSKGNNIKLVAHHLNSWNWCIEKRFDIANGITLCRKCHTKFHTIYGFGNNTKQQYKEFVKTK